MDNQEKDKISRKSIIVTMSVSVVCLIAVIFAATYAYFRPQIVGEGKDINVVSGKIKLAISEEVITATNLAPILDSTKDTKAAKNTFTISRTEDSNLNACYSLNLVVKKIGSNLQNKYFKYELTYGNGETIEGDFSDYSTRTPDENGEVTISLLTNQSITNTNESNTYTLRLWLSYDPDEDQTNLLYDPATKQGTTAESRSFEAYVQATGKSGSCEVQGS